MSQKPKRLFDREFKLAAVRRMLAGENVSALAREMGVLRKDLYVWRDRFRSGGPAALRPPGRPRRSDAEMAGLPPVAASDPLPEPTVRFRGHYT